MEAYYHGEPIAPHTIDVIVNDKVIVENKTVERYPPTHHPNCSVTCAAFLVASRISIASSARTASSVDPNSNGAKPIRPCQLVPVPTRLCPYQKWYTPSSVRLRSQYWGTPSDPDRILVTGRRRDDRYDIVVSIERSRSDTGEPFHAFGLLQQNSPTRIHEDPEKRTLSWFSSFPMVSALHR
jgi:hypothetical protein